MVRNPADLYTAGAERFNSQPSVSLYANLLARKQAKIDALDQYDMKRINSINDAGLRDRDRQAFDQQLQELQGHYNTNKDKIRKGNTPEAYEYEKKIRDIGSFVNASKERTAKQESAMKFYQERLKQDGVVPDDFIAELDMNDKGLAEENSQTFNLNKWLSSPKPFNQKTYLNSFADIKRTPQAPRYEKVAGNPLKETEIIDETFDDGGKRVIHARAADKYENSYSFRSQVQNEVKDPIRRKQLGELFKNEFGVDPAMPEDYATAYTMELLQPKISKVKSEYDKGAIMDRQENFREKMFRIAESGRNYRASLNRVRPNLGDYDILSLYDPKVQEIEVEVPVGQQTWWNGKKVEKKKVNVIYTKDIDGNDEKYFEGADPISGKDGRTYYIQRDDGNYEGANNKVIQRTTAAIKFMGNPAAYKGGILNKGGGATQKPTKQNTAPKPKKDPLGLF